MLYNEYFGYYAIEIWEWITVPIYLLIIFMLAARTRNKHIARHPEYKYYMWGLYAKLAGGIGLCLIYVYYYKGGDTIMYYQSGCAMSNLFFERPSEFFTVLFGSNTRENLMLFDTQTGYPLGYLYFDSKTFFVIRLITPILIVSFNSYLIGTILLAWISYSGIWQVYRLFCSYYPKLSFQFALAILFLPSVVFWGSGILKDTITLTSTCWLVCCIHKIFVAKQKRTAYSLLALFCSGLIIAIKPYIFMALIPGAISWIFFVRISKIQSRAWKYASIPLIYLASFTLGIGIMSVLGSYLDKFSLDKLINTAVVTQNDLKQDYYQGNSFDIGDIDPSVAGVLSKFPVATVAGIYRPFLWDANNAVMLVSALENTFILLVSIYLLLRMRFKQLLKIIFNNPLLLFSLSYSVLLAFSVGLSTSNFGALVRFKIPYLSFFMCGLFIMNYFVSNPINQRKFSMRNSAPRSRPSSSYPQASA